ncbi:MAG: hypothetical protein AB2693_30030 [Candidatus Thiodiazotropha sp.]
MIGGVEQNPGPPRYPPVRANAPNAPNTRARASSQSTLGVNEAGDLGISRRLSHADDNTNMTQLLAGMRADMNLNMTGIHEKLSDLNTKVDNISQTCRDLQTENANLSAQNLDLKKKVDSLESRIDSIEGHSRRNNLIFHGIQGSLSEKWDETEQKVRSFMTDTLELPQADTVNIERAHRLRTRRNRDKPPIIVKFSSFKDKSSILHSARSKLRDSDGSFRVSEDFTPRVRNIRKTLGSYVVRARNSNRSAALSFDKLIIDDKIYKLDEESQKPVYVAKNKNFVDRTRGEAHVTYQQQQNTTDVTVESQIPLDDYWERDLLPQSGSHEREDEGGEFMASGQ